MTQMQDIIEVLAAAKAAMEENPKLQAQIANLESKFAAMQNAHQDLTYEHNEVRADREHALNAIKTLEAQLEAARFQELATRQKLETIVSSVRGTLDEVVPIPVQTPEPSPADVGEHTEVSIEQDPIIDEASEDSRVNERDPPAKAESSVTGGEAEGFLYRGPISWPELEAERTAKAEDFSPSSEPQFLAETGETITEFKEYTPQEAKPYFGKPFSFKPDSVSWPDWIAGGGNRPWWLTDRELSKMTA